MNRRKFIGLSGAFSIAPALAIAAPVVKEPIEIGTVRAFLGRSFSVSDHGGVARAVCPIVYKIWDGEKWAELHTSHDA